MRLTRRYLGEAALGAVLVGAAAVTGRPEPLVGAVGIVGALLGSGAAFRRAADGTLADLTVARTPDRNRVGAGSDVEVRFAASLSRPAGVDLRVTAAVPAGAAAPGSRERTLELPAGTTSAETTYLLRWVVGGDHRLGPVTVVVSDRWGRFARTVTVDAGGTVRVQSGAARDVAAGRAAVRSALERDGERAVAEGIEVDGVRRYLPSDRFSRIDWKATARRNGLYVRETTSESDPVTALFVDHRARTAARAASGSELDYLRDAALTVERLSRERHRPLALYAVGDEGVTAALPPARTGSGYAAVRRVLDRLEPTPSPTAAGGGANARSATAGAGTDDRRRDRLADEDSRFARAVGPFLDGRATYLRRVADDPLSRTVRATLRAIGPDARVVLCTDDRDAGELAEAVRAARAARADVTVVLAPGVSFDPFAGVAATYDRLSAFETLRRRLEARDGIRVVEVGPSTALDRGGSRRARREPDRPVSQPGIGGGSAPAADPLEVRP